MDGFNSKEFYGHSLSEDPKLRTTTRNYEFKYNSSEHLERIINRVKMDREKKKEIEQLSRNDDSHVKFHNRLTNTQKSQVINKIPFIETQIGSSRSREAVVKIMSDEEIDAMLSQALQSTDNLHVLPETKSDEIQRDEKLPQFSVEILPNLQPKWVEIKPIQKSTASIFQVPDVDTYYAEDSSDSEELLSALNLGDKTLENEKHEFNETINKNNILNAFSLDSIISEDFVIRNEESTTFQKDENDDEKSSPPESLISLDIESNILNESEHLEMERVFEKALPYIPKMNFNKLEVDEKSEYDLYLDEEMEDTKTQEDDSFREEEFETQTQPEIHISKIDHTTRPIHNISIRSAQYSPPKTSKPTIKKTAALQKGAKGLCSNRNSPKAPPSEVRLNNLIENLKQEKLGIFSKMTSIQEKIIKSLDALRINLVEISLPNDEIEKKLRKRNALEFSVRFSRNYLFPLGKMIDDLRLSPKEEYSSALTNEPCVKVCGIYGLLSQAIQCYQKQLRHFFTDCFPKKLDLLLNLIKDATIICLEKQVFDKRDTLIQSLLSRCEMFLEFVLEFAEKKKCARNEEMALQSERRSRFKLPKTSSKWDLTMNLNNLNMYEPKLVQKKTKKTPQKKTMKSYSQSRASTSKTKKTKLMARDSADHIALPIDDPVETQVRKDNNIDSVQLINDAIAKEPDGELVKSVIETLQDITKDEVHQMFGPIVLHLDSILKSSDNPHTAVESLLNVLRSKIQEVKGKHLKIDEIATENSTQNSNSYQKEVTKKGTHLSNIKQQKQQFKETRHNNKVSKAKAKLANCNSENVKEDSTEQTERYSRSELTDTNTICDKQSLRNIDVVVAALVSENNSMKQKTCGGAFLSATAVAQAAKKPTPAPDRNEVGGIAAAAALPPLTPLNTLPVKLDDVMPPSPPPPLSQDLMTSEQCLDYSSALPMGLPRADKFVSERHNIIGDGKHRKEDAASQRNVRDGAANAIDRAEDNQEAWRKNLPAAAASSPVRNEATKSGEMGKLYYRSNALYTFLNYLENSLPAQNEQDITENVNKNSNNINVRNEIKEQKEDNTGKTAKEDIFECPKDTLADISSEKQTEEEHHQNDIDIKALLEERKNFIERCKDDPFYTNSQFPQPWKVLSKISKVIAREIVEDFESDLSFGEESYIRDFIDMEIQT